MEVVFTLFRVFCSFAVDILYDISLVNNLFGFDLDKKMIILKERKKEKKIHFPQERGQRMDVPRKYIRKNFSTKSVRINDEIVSPSKNRINEDMTSPLMSISRL